MGSGRSFAAVLIVFFAARCAASSSALPYSVGSESRDFVAAPLSLDAGATAGDGQRPDEHIRFRLEGTYLFGDVRGSLQTPAGGQPGSTSLRRPTYREIGIHQLNIADVSGAVGWGPHEIYGGAQFINPSGRATLGSALVTNGVTFPGGSHVHSDVNLDWYRVGYRYRWVIQRGGGELPEWTVYPSVGGALFTYDYRLSSASVRASRSYSKALPQLGLELDWRPGGGRLELSAGAMGFPQVSSIPAIIVEQASARYRLLQRRSLGVDGFVGVQWEQIYFEDNQPVPNRIHADLGPLLKVGISIGY